MIQNIKADIVYYKTNTDFEMEFNLCGCCRMRLLTLKATEKKSFVSGLARAVSRSNIILVVGSLFGEDNIISNVAGAIGKNIVPIDNKQYGINSSEEISVISDAVPLVTSEGIFGGCIIESGPQTMILLSESKNVRKNIMNSLVHQYIREIYADGIKESPVEEISEEPNEEVLEENNTVEEVEMEEELETEAPEIEVEEPEVVEITENDADNNQELEVDSTVEEQEYVQELSEDDDEESNEEALDEESYDTVFEIDSRGIELFTEAKKIRKRESKYYNEAYTDFALDNSGFVKDDEYEGYYNSFSKSKIAIIILSILILIALAVICYCMFYVPSKDGVSATTYVRDIYDTLFG